MAAGNEVSSTYYIQHHLQNLTFGKHPENGWSLAHSAEEAREMGFWAIHLDTMGWSIAMGLLFIWIFRKAGKAATTGVPSGLQNAVEMVVEFIEKLTRGGIPVMAHIGFTPQSEHGLGGHVIQGRGDAADQLLADAHAVEEAGAFAVVLEMVPAEAAQRVTAELSIPTISVGGGPHCDGQLVVWTDWAGLAGGRIPKFVKQYANLRQVLTDAALAYKADVESGAYPDEQHSYSDATAEQALQDRAN